MTAARDALDGLTWVTPDFPEPGILFRDLSPVFADAEALRSVSAALVDGVEADAVAGIEARGFVLAAAAAALTGRGALVIRKAGKLPPPTLRRDYALEYGTATIELPAGILEPGSRVVVVDDVLATGGTLRASIDLLREAGLVVDTVAVALELGDLRGRDRLPDVEVRALLTT